MVLKIFRKCAGASWYATIAFAVSGVGVSAQNRIDPAVLKAAQSYCLEKGLSIVSEEFSSCVSDRIYALTAPAPQPSTAPEQEASIEPKRSVEPAKEAPYEAKVQMYPESTLFGHNDPDFNALGHKISKHDLRIETYPQGLVAVVRYNRNDKLGDKGGFREMYCTTPCVVKIPVNNQWSVKLQNAEGMYLASTLPQWKRNLFYGFKLDPNVIVFKKNTIQK